MGISLSQSKELMEVICIEPESFFIPELKSGEVYLIPRGSIFLDCDGDAFGEVLKPNNTTERIGIYRLSHFKSVI